MSPTPPGDAGGFVAKNLSRILVGALVGLLVAAFFALRSPAGFEARTDVLVTRLAVTDLGENSLDGTTPLDAEIRFAKSGTVRDVVRGAIPTAPNSLEVTARDDANVLTFIAPGDTADEAIRLSRNWASAYIAQRRDVLIATWTDRSATIDAELEGLITELGTARLAGDDESAARLEARRDAAAAEAAAAAASIRALEADPGAELFGSAPQASETGRSLAAMGMLGTILGGLATGAWLAWRGQQTEDEAEAQSWLRHATDGSLERVMTAGMLDVPAFLLEEPSPQPMPMPVPPVPVAQVPVPAAQPPIVPPQIAPLQVAPPATPVLAPEPALEPEPEPAVANGTPRPANTLASKGRTTATIDKPAVQPLRIAKIAQRAAATQRPVLSRPDQAWADDISLTSDG